MIQIFAAVATRHEKKVKPPRQNAFSRNVHKLEAQVQTSASVLKLIITNVFVSSSSSREVNWK